MADAVELDWLVTKMNTLTSRRRLLVMASLLAAVVWATCTGCNSKSQSQATPVAAAEVPAATPVTVATSTPSAPSNLQDPKSFITTGPLVAEQQADIAAELNGRIASIAVQIGDHVKQGQLLAQLDDRALRSACDSKKARIASAQAEVSDWEAEEMSARADLRRADEMKAASIMTDEDWEHVKYKLDETIDEVTRYKSEEAAAEADYSAANLQLEETRIVAPFSGVIGRSSVRPAQEVKAGDVLFWITAEAPLDVLFTVPETLMASFSTGKALDLTTADYPGLHQAGRILRVSPVVDPASGSLQVIGAVVHPSPQLKPGMSMQVRLAP